MQGKMDNFGGMGSVGLRYRLNVQKGGGKHMAGETIAYVRVSTVEQNEERQVEMLKKYGITKWYIDKAGGTNERVQDNSL